MSLRVIFALMPAVALPRQQDSHRNVLVALIAPQLAVAVFGESNATDEEWREYMRVLGDMPASGNRMAVFSAGGGPSPTQRKELEDLTATKGEDLRVAIITASRIARGIVTAIRWYRGDSNAAFDPKRLDLAFSFLKLNEEEQAAVITYAQAMATRLDVAENLGLSG